MQGSSKCRAWFLPALSLCVVMAASLAIGQEVTYPAEDMKRLDAFESHMLTNADKFFAKKDYRRAGAEFDSFLLEFPKSKAAVYALLRKARSLHLDNKRFEAIKVYEEVLDYFPDDVHYAAAALYYHGLCHQQNGDVEEALKSWIDLADDVEYSRHWLAAPALKALAENSEKQGKHDLAAKYYDLVAVNFRLVSGGHTARQSLEKAINYYLRLQPDKEKLRNLYIEAKGFGHHPVKKESVLEVELEEDVTYWNTVRGRVRKHGTFNQFQEEQKKQYYRYWAQALAGRFPDNDDYQIDVISFQHLHSGDTAAWLSALDKQYQADVMRGGYHERILKWIRLFGDQRERVEALYKTCKFDQMEDRLVQDLLQILYADAKCPDLARELFPKLPFDKMPAARMKGLLLFLFDKAKDKEMATFLFGKFRFDEMNDKQKAGLARSLWGKDEELVIRACRAITDKDLSDLNQLRYWHRRRDAKEGLPLADKLRTSPDHTGEAHWLKAEFHQWAKQWEDAIKAYRKTGREPYSLWRMVDCYVGWGKQKEAVAQLREIENFFKKQSSKAALRIADVYKRAGMEPQRIASLRRLMKKYPKSRESSLAHGQLEALGVRIGGGEDAE
ncbi:MAG: tetratricopeptide repeat protein [Lentisphaerae bacterium]|jgi:TolA-binding protein|nr:tetratricopeptide repeat protein [Lentisphaerota bacterium]MBT4822371.1 tetratricopeptide repeat protein [Lentisphaerota bacterium]MBT5611895.1 tetratricopeptide repeat protein [Lentisphaerota bacterium]MBT7055508.1 tetratricopeptide repeat protein [Lentisphaerota bacterium]MBT7847512.1 tetratricopeptide repeat protein [Lentisphaerota bacterium]